MIHSSEPNINTLKQIRQDLYSAESTDENLKKIKAVEAQIKRHEAETPVKK